VKSYPTASKVHLAADCLYPWSGEIAGRDGPVHAYSARLGNLVHKMLEKAAVGEIPSAKALGPLYRATPRMVELAEEKYMQGAVVIDEVRQGALRVMSEVAVVKYTDGTSSLLELPAPRAYPFDRPGLYGTADLVVEYEDSVYVADWKTGLVKEPGTSKAESQVQFLSDAISQALGKPARKGHAVYLGGKSPYKIEAKGDAPARALHRVGLAMYRPEPGEHCNYCDVKTMCKYRKV
jgi:ATP-dependent exoDNAse (exonuclease V) beta subunit